MGAGEAEAVLVPDRLAGRRAGDALGNVSLEEGADGYEAAALDDSLRPHAATAAPELVEGGLYAGVEDGVRRSVEWESPLESGRPEAARAVWHEERDLRARADVVDGIWVLDELYAVAARAARVEHCLSILHRERAEPHAHRRLLSSLGAIITGDPPL